MTLKRHVQTLATVIRAGDTTTLVSLDDWYGGQILAPVDTLTLQDATGLPHEELPDTRLHVMALLTASRAEELDLQQWEPCHDAGRARAA